MRCRSAAGSPRRGRTRSGRPRSATFPARREGLLQWNYSFVNRASEAGLDAFGECSKIADALDFVIRQLDLKVIFQARKHFQRLQAVNAELLVEIVLGR